MNAPVIQGSEEWFAQRVGKVTASRLADVLAKTKSGYSTSRTNYLAELVAERLTGKVAEGFTNSAIKWGTDCEPLARSAVEVELDVMIAETGMVPHPTIAMAGASPDGLIGPEAVLECKCPNTATHIETLLSGEAPTKYIPQMQFQMACTGRKYAIFASFDPRLPADMQLFTKRVDRDEKYIAEAEAEVIKFLAEVEETVAKLIALRRAN